jgi:hypothetical protein
MGDQIVARSAAQSAENADLTNDCAHLCANNQALTRAKMMPIINQVFVCGWRIPPPRAKRMSAAARKAKESAARMYFAATESHVIFASNRCWRHAGALVLKSGVPGSSRHK